MQAGTQRPSGDVPYALIIFGGTDPHGRAVSECLARRGIPTVALDYQRPISLGLEFANDGTWSVKLEQDRLPPPSVAWSRFKMAPPQEVTTQAQAFEALRVSEWSGFVFGLRTLIPGKFLNGAANVSSKIAQQELAARAGFDIPESTFFLGKEIGAAFLSGGTPVIMKAISNPNIASEQEGRLTYDSIVTTAVDPTHFADIDERRLKVSPTWFQHRIGSGVEHRVIVIGNWLYSAKMTRAVEDRTLADGRIGNTFEPCTLDTSVERALFKYCSLAGVDYGVFDLIESEGHWYFLECNHEGQWQSALPDNFDKVVEKVADLIAARLCNSQSAQSDPVSPSRLGLKGEAFHAGR